MTANRTSLLCLLFVLCLVSGCDRGTPLDPTRQDRELLRNSTDDVWYNAERGELEKVSVNASQIDASDRHDSIATPAAPWNNNGNWFRNTFGDFFQMLFRYWQILLAICLIALLALGVFLVLKKGGYVGAAPRQRAQEKKRRDAVIQDLPFELEQTQRGLLGQADYYRQQGDYSKAIIYLFSHVLIEMDNARFIHLQRGKTNRAYLRELRDQDQLRGFANQIVMAFEYTFFGKHPLGQEAFERIWKQLPDFASCLKQPESASTTARYSKSIVGNAS